MAGFVTERAAGRVEGDRYDERGPDGHARYHGLDRAEPGGPLRTIASRVRGVDVRMLSLLERARRLGSVPQASAPSRTGEAVEVAKAPELVGIGELARAAHAELDLAAGTLDRLEEAFDHLEKLAA